MEVLHGLLGVVAEILGIPLIDTRRLAVGDQQHQLFLIGLLQKMVTGIAQRSTHAGRQAAFHPRLGRIGVGLLEVLLLTTPSPMR